MKTFIVSFCVLAGILLVAGIIGSLERDAKKEAPAVESEPQSAPVLASARPLVTADGFTIYYFRGEVGDRCYFVKYGGANVSLACTH